MTRIDVKVTFDRPLSEAFSVLADVEKTPPLIVARLI